MYNFTDRKSIFLNSKYFYSEFKGEKFISEYLSNRFKFIEFKKLCDSAFLNLCGSKLRKFDSELIYEWESKLLDHDIKMVRDINLCPQKRYDNFLKKTPIKTLEVLNEVFEKYKNKSCKIELFELAEVLTKRFEVSKKIYSEYDSYFLKGRGDFEDIENYIAFSKILILMLLEEIDLKFVNTLLKLNDIICALINIEKIRNSAVSEILFFESVLIEFLYNK